MNTAHDINIWFVIGVGKGKKKNGMLDYTANHDYISNLQKNSKI